MFSRNMVITKFKIFSGPVVSALCNKYGCRAVCVAGSLVASAAFVLSTFSKSVTMMMITYGLIGGKPYCIIETYIAYITNNNHSSIIDKRNILKGFKEKEILTCAHDPVTYRCTNRVPVQY